MGQTRFRGNLWGREGWEGGEGGGDDNFSG